MDNSAHLRQGYSHRMSNTSPEKRMDKNGRLVTRHIKQRGPEAWGWVAPSPARKQDDQALRTEIGAAINLYRESYKIDEVRSENLPALTRLVKSFDYSNMYDDILNMGQRFPAEQFSKCVRLLMAHQEEAVDNLESGTYSDGKGDMVMLVTGLNRHKFRMTKEQRSRLIVGVCKLWSSDHMENIEHLNSVFPRRDDGTTLVAFNNATIREDLAKLIVNNPEKFDFIIDCIGSRQISDLDALKDLMNNSSSVALSEGSL